MPQRTFSTGQDHKEQVFFIRSRDDAKEKKPATANAAARAVAQGKAAVEKKQYAAGNQHNAGLGARAKKIADDTETTKVKTVAHNVSINIQRARQAKGMNQKELAQVLNEKQSVVTDYESGKAVPNEQVLQRMEKALGVYLRGTKAGQVMERKGSRS